MIPQFDHLDSKRWVKARNDARKRVIDGLQKPNPKAFFDEPREHAAWMVGTGIFFALIIGLATFLMSASHQIIAYDAMNAQLPTLDPLRITNAFVTVLVLAGLCVGEVGVIGFGYVASVLAKERLMKTLLRIASGACLALALAVNIAAFSLYHNDALVAVEAAYAVVPPVFAAGVGLMIEVIVINAARNRQRVLNSLDQATKAYNIAIADPELHPSFEVLYKQSILDQLLATKRNREILLSLIEDDPTLRSQIVSDEIARHSWDAIPSQIVSPETTEITTRSQARQLLVSDGSLMRLTIDQLVGKYGGSRATWGRAKQEETAFSANGHTNHTDPA